ncbi:MAG: TRAP transporter substrate-binding protein DctP, partial [Deferrisomatales bacterium]
MNRGRRFTAWALGAAALVAAAPAALAARELRISHQFAEGDARHDLAVAFGKAVEEKTKGELTFKVFPSQALFKAAAQYDAMAKGALDLSIYPLAYASGKIPELDVTLMPCIITSVEEGMAWRNKAI